MNLSKELAVVRRCETARATWVDGVRRYLATEPLKPFNLSDPAEELLRSAIRHLELCREAECRRLWPHLYCMAAGREAPRHWFTPRFMGEEVCQLLGLGEKTPQSQHGFHREVWERARERNKEGENGGVRIPPPDPERDAVVRAVQHLRTCSNPQCEWWRREA